jgi:hypothetical protein
MSDQNAVKEDASGQCASTAELGWQPASNPPQGKMGKWTRDVIVVTNYDDVFTLGYFHDANGGCWQRCGRFNNGEKAEWWIDKPVPNVQGQPTAR